jgi:UDP-N-acetylglucosamine pyrophosphorylase
LKKADVVAQCIEKEEADQKMGAFIEKEGKVIEYTELDPSVQYRYAYSGQLGFSLPFFCQMAEVDLPTHWVEKNVSGKKVWKGEKFIFDVFPYAKRVKPFCVPKETHYAPVKGPESLGKVQQLLRERR